MSIFKNEIALSYEFVPKLIPFRKKQQIAVAKCILPLFKNKPAKNILVINSNEYCATGIRHVLEELEKKTDRIIPFYLNCKLYKTSNDILLQLCDLIDYKEIATKTTEEIVDAIITRIQDYACVFVFDEIDKATDLDFLFLMTKKFKLKSIIIITRYPKFYGTVHSQIKSLLLPVKIDFKPYSKQEIRGILRQRVELAFLPKTIESEAFNLIFNKTILLRDIRSGLYLLKESGLNAEELSEKTITVSSAQKAINKLNTFYANSAIFHRD